MNILPKTKAKVRRKMVAVLPRPAAEWRVHFSPRPQAFKNPVFKSQRGLWVSEL